MWSVVWQLTEPRPTPTLASASNPEPTTNPKVSGDAGSNYAVGGRLHSKLVVENKYFEDIGKAFTYMYDEDAADSRIMNSPFDYPGVNNQLSAQDALKHVTNNVGASLVRDAVDEMLIRQVSSYGIEGQIINTEDDNGISGNVGSVANGTTATDSDRDGMPDEWETQEG